MKIHEKLLRHSQMSAHEDDRRRNLSHLLYEILFPFLLIFIFVSSFTVLSVLHDEKKEGRKKEFYVLLLQNFITLHNKQQKRHQNTNIFLSKCELFIFNSAGSEREIFKLTHFV